jgi:DDE superfamily endonuclease
MWCIPTVDKEFIERMEDVLKLLAKPRNKLEPVVALDERPVQLLDSARPGRAATPGKFARRDYEYVRLGTANIFCVVEPRGGRHWTHATRNRKAPKFAEVLRKVAATHAAAKTIHLVMDNLNTHCEMSLCTTFGPWEGRALWKRFTVHYTPKHGSWLNPAETEVGLWSRECLGKDRIPEFSTLRRRTRAWNTRANRQRRKINWRYTTTQSRRDFRYKKVGATIRTEH